MIDITTAAERLGLSPRRLRALCLEGRVKGAQLIGRTWVLPDRISAKSITPGKRGPKLSV